MKLSKITIAVCAALPIYVLAQDAKTEKLEEISVMAFRDNSQFAQYVNTSEQVDKNTLQKEQATSVADALKHISNVDIKGGSRAIAQKPVIRGLTDNRVVQIVDGVRQNFDLAHRGSYFIAPTLIQDIQVLKGPSSTLWGSGALGGAVVVRTANALDLLKNNEKIGAKIRQGYQSANSLSETDVAVYGANNQFDWLLQGFYNDADDLRLGSGTDLPHSGYKQKGGMAKLGWQIDDANRVELSYRLSQLTQTAPSNNEAVSEFTADQIESKIRNFHRQNPSLDAIYDFYGKLHNELGSVSYLSKQKITDQSTALNYYLNPENNPYLNAQFTLYHNRTVEKEQRVVSGLEDQTKLSTTGFNLRNSSDFNWLNLTYGVDFYQDHAKTERGTNNTDGQFRANPYDAKARVFGAYMLAHIPFGERVIFSPSVRYDSYQTRSEQTKYSDHHWSPTLALTWKATDWFDLTAKYNEAFRAPSLQERFVSGAHFGVTGRSGPTINRFVANPNLKPETARNKEINARFHFDNVFAKQDKFVFNATYFQNDVKDFINLEVYKASAMEPFPTKSQYRNVEDARLRGFELDAQYQLNPITLGLSYGQTRGKNKNTDQPLDNIAADKLSFAVNYELVQDKFNIGARVTRYSSQNRVAKGEGYKGYTLADLTATYAPLKGEWENLRIDFAIENLFDKEYQPAFSLMEGAGRNVKVGVSYRF